MKVPTGSDWSLSPKRIHHQQHLHLVPKSAICWLTLINSIGHTHVASIAPAMHPAAIGRRGLFFFGGWAAIVPSLPLWMEVLFWFWIAAFCLQSSASRISFPSFESVRRPTSKSADVALESSAGRRLTSFFFVFSALDTVLDVSAEN